MGKLCECDEVPLEVFAIVAAERDSLRDGLNKASKAIRDLLALQNPREASTYAHQQTAQRAQALVADLERLHATTAVITPKR